MSLNQIHSDQKKVTLNHHTYEKLKNFSRLNGLKLSAVIDAFAVLLSEDDLIKEHIIKLVIKNQSE
ncbi:MAG: hypothetical protein CTY19_07015 [Methylomonas sp.]|jgi:hypothetical protein|nr:MAG: hypothetical protein CTY19_07015 [Methylomonas sp.]